jgi:hypothetical protein
MQALFVWVIFMPLLCTAGSAIAKLGRWEACRRRITERLLAAEISV